MDKFLFGGMIGALLWFAFIYESPHKIVYDCRLSEISVDYPAQVKDECRRLNKIRIGKIHER
jgi:hypothetical protein